MKSFADILQEKSTLEDMDLDNLNPEEAALLEQEILRLDNMEKDKIDSFVSYIKGCSARAEFLRKEADALKTKAQRLEANINWLKSRYLMTLERHGREKASGNLYSIRRAKNEYVRILDRAEIPDEYLVHKEESLPNKTLIREHLKEGVIIPGAELGVSSSLVIR